MLNGAPARFLAASFFVAAACSFLFGLVAFVAQPMVRHSLENSLRIRAEFQAATAFLTRFRETHRRIPSAVEWELWSAGRGAWGTIPLVAYPESQGFAEEAVAALGEPPPGGFILGIWRGEWMEFHATWSGATTVPLEEAAYYTFRNRPADMLAGFGFSFVCGAAGRFMWRRGRRVVEEEDRDLIPGA